MQIPPHLFQAAAVALRSAQQSSEHSAATERRREPRVPLLSATTMIPCCGRLPRTQVTIEVHDLSEHGIGIIMRAPALHAKEQFILPLLGSPGCDWKAALFEATRWGHLPNEWFTVGARFLREVFPAARYDPSNLVAVSDVTGVGFAVDRVAAALTARAIHQLTDKEREQVRELEERLGRLPI